ncbi:hypothetical protein NS383_18875 [Pseudomonas oryzihabitans]|nr:hypothetical protein NS383_18875 [Pseudomonas psychrotolerans]
MAEKWLERAVIQGLQGLVALRLDGAPAADAITMTLDVWLVALGKGRSWEEERDVWRIQAAFSTLFATCERWPAPAALLRQLPPPKGWATLPKPAVSEEQRINGRRHIADITARLKGLAPTTETEQQPQ